LFLKKNIKLAEWRKYFTGKDSPDLQLRRTSLLEALSRELGFDRVMEITIDEGLRKQLENDQIAVNNELDNSYVALFQKAVDRGEANGGAMASKALIESSKGSGKDLKELKKQWLTIFVPGEIVDKEKLKKERPNDYELLADIISRVNGFGLVEIQKEGAKLRDQGVGDSVILEGILTDPNKAMSDRTQQEREALGEAMAVFEKLTSEVVVGASTSQTSNLKRLFPNVFGFTSRSDINIKDKKVNAEEYESIIEKVKANSKILSEIEASTELKAAWKKVEDLLIETSLVGLNAKGKKDISGAFLTNTFNRNIDAFINKFDRIQELPRERGETEIAAINRRIELLDKYAKTPEGKAAIKDIKFKDALLNASLLTFGEMFNFGGKLQKAKVADLLASTLLNNDGVGFRAFSSQRYFAFTGESSPTIITPTAFDPVTNKKLTKKEIKEYTEDNKEIKYKNIKSRATAKNEHLNPKQKFGVRVLEALMNNDLINPEVVKALTSGS
jgi:hypothetical protein